MLEEPLIEEPLMEPVLEEPLIEEPLMEPVLEEPLIEEPVIEPLIEESLIEPVMEEPLTEEPPMDMPVMEEPVMEPPMDVPVLEEPLIEEPLMDEPVLEEPVAGDAPIADTKDGRTFGRKRNGSPVAATSRKSRGGRGKNTVVGLKIGASQIAAAVVTETEGRYELMQLARRPIEGGLVVDGEIRDQEALAHQLKLFFDEHKLPTEGRPHRACEQSHRCPDVRHRRHRR